MPLLGNDYQPPSQLPTGLSLPGQGPVAAPRRDPTLNELVGGTANVLSQIPGFAARNVGPLLVGRNLQGPQSSAEAFQRLGANYEVPWQRALGHGLGAGLDMMADPTMLMGMGGGAGRVAVPEGLLTRQLEQFASPRSSVMSPWGAEVLSRARIADPSRVPVAIPRTRGLPAAESLPATIPGGGAPAAPTTIQRPGQLPFTPPAEVRPIPAQGNYRPPTPPGTPGSVQSFAHDADAMRSLQLNSPHFNPAEQAFGLGTGQFTQDASQAARYGLGEYNPLTTSQLLPSAGAATPSNPLLSRLERLTGRIPPRPQSSGSQIDY